MLEREEKDLLGAQSAASDMETEKGHLQNDIKQFQQLIRSLEEHRVTTNNKLATSQAELESCEAELKKFSAEKERLAERVATQGISAQDVQRMNEEKGALTEKLKYHTSLNEKQAEELWKREMEISKKVEAVDRSVITYKSLANRLGLIPVGAKYAAGIDYNLEVDTNQDDAISAMSIDVKNQVRPGLATLKESFVSETRALNDECIVWEQRNQDANEERERREEELRALEEKQQRLETQYQREKEVASTKLRSAAGEADQIEQKLEKLMSTANAELQNSEQQVRSAESEYHRVLDTLQEEKEDLRQRLLHAMDMMSKHKQNLQSLLQSTNKRVKDVQAETKAIVSH